MSKAPGSKAPESKTPGVSPAALLVFVAASAAISLPARAALEPGEPVPDFSAAALQRGHQFPVTLSDALGHGPVVLIFAPAKLAAGCGAGGNALADTVARYRDYDATVIGVSNDNLGSLRQLETTGCDTAMPVAADPHQQIADAFGAQHAVDSRDALTTYVITPDGTVLYHDSSPSPDAPATKAPLAALQDWVARSKP